MKPSLRSPRAPSISRPKPPDGPTMPRFGGASPSQAPRYVVLAILEASTKERYDARLQPRLTLGANGRG